jgi:hypothetical protein
LLAQLAPVNLNSIVIFRVQESEEALQEVLAWTFALSRSANTGRRREEEITALTSRCQCPRAAELPGYVFAAHHREHFAADLPRGRHGTGPLASQAELATDAVSAKVFQ